MAILATVGIAATARKASGGLGDLNVVIFGSKQSHS